MIRKISVVFFTCFAIQQFLASMQAVLLHGMFFWVWDSAMAASHRVIGIPQPMA